MALLTKERWHDVADLSTDGHVHRFVDRDACMVCNKSGKLIEMDRFSLLRARR